MLESRIDSLLAGSIRDPATLAILLDVDGTLAPIVRDSADASVPTEVRRTLIGLNRRFGLVACVSGRQSEDARRVVGVGGLTYIGGHGSELLRPGVSEPEVDPQLDIWGEPVTETATEAARELHGLGIRREEKGAIAALHWRGAPDEDEARTALEQVAERAEARGLAVHWGRKVLEIRPPVPFDKGRAVRKLLSDDVSTPGIGAALYAGDDTTDLDVFRILDSMVADGDLEVAVKVAVASTESPPDLIAESDIAVAGPEGAADLLLELLEADKQ